MISISGPPDLTFAKDIGLGFFLQFVMTLLSLKVRRAAKNLNVRYNFLFMRAEGQQLGEITKLIESGKIKPVVDKVFSFNATNDALAYVESGRAAGKVVIEVS